MHGVARKEGVGMRGGTQDGMPHKRRPFRGYRTEEEFKATFHKGELGWSELHKYFEWRKSELKDSIVTLRISGTDLMKLKALARMKGKKYQSYMGEILKQEIHWQEDLLADGTADPTEVDSRGVGSMRADADPEGPGARGAGPRRRRMRSR
jgi:predicted DNA binding CopG/RHH family protein